MTEMEKASRDHWVKVHALADLRDGYAMTKGHLMNGMDPPTALLGHVIFAVTVAEWAIERQKIEEISEVTEAERMAIIHDLQKRINQKV